VYKEKTSDGGKIKCFHCGGSGLRYSLDITGPSICKVCGGKGWTLSSEIQEIILKEQKRILGIINATLWCSTDPSLSTVQISKIMTSIESDINSGISLEKEGRK
jgi:hypothetical protein